MKTLKELIDLISLKKIDENRFEGENFQTPWGRVFGGQVLAQSLHAAYQTVPKNRFAHSMHGYFILGGNLGITHPWAGGSGTAARAAAASNAIRRSS